MTAKKMGKNQEGGKAFAFKRRGRTKAIPVMYSNDDSSTAQDDSLEAAREAVRMATNRQPEKSSERQSKRQLRSTYKSSQNGSRKNSQRGSQNDKKTATKANRTTACTKQ